MALDEQQKLLNSASLQKATACLEDVPSCQSASLKSGGPPSPSPLSERSSQQLLQTPLESVPSTTCCQGINPTALLLESPLNGGEAARYASKQHKKIAGRATFQGQVYNFLERPDNWKCFVYHIIVACPESNVSEFFFPRLYAPARALRAGIVRSHHSFFESRYSDPVQEKMQRSLEQRMAIKFCVKLEKSAAETIPMLKKAFGVDCLSDRQIFHQPPVPTIM
ncbi:hypothetical protein NQ318_005269 [Aromia moschata]|uniref:Uncharacterized protein n=1 Tax=Aromia moschata TaxID=1265417 RepID=A0AAV8Y127_9CUCU|nr:hypothetical protein NQ318_005269 [Aromia moschata]